MSFPPEAYLIGAQKAGTTSLAYLLNQHPHIAVAQSKEPHFFTDNWNKGFDWYRRQYPDSPNTICIDASTSYAMAPLTGRWKRRSPKIYENVPARVCSVRPDAKLIYLLREPADRTYSGYWHDVRMGAENQEFRTAVQSNSFYLDVSDYYGQLLRWLDHFPLRSFHFILFEDMKEDPERVVKECFKFLGVSEETTSIRLDSAQNQSYQVGWLGRRVNKIAVTYPGFRTLLKTIVPRNVRGIVKNTKVGTSPIPAMNQEDRVFLAEYFRDRNQNLEQLISVSLDRWR